MLRKEPGLGLLGLGLKPTTSTLSYIPVRRGTLPGVFIGELGERARKKGSRRRRSKRSGRQRREEEGEEGKSSHLPNTLTGGGEGGGGEGGRAEKRDMTGPCDLSALWKGAQGGVCVCACVCAFSKMSF